MREVNLKQVGEEREGRVSITSVVYDSIEALYRHGIDRWLATAAVPDKSWLDHNGPSLQSSPVDVGVRRSVLC